MTVKEIKIKLDELGVAYTQYMNKGELEALLPAVPPSDLVPPVTAPVVPPSTQVPLTPIVYKLSIKVKGIDEDGDKTVITYEGEGATLAEALEKLEFPPRLNMLIKVTATVGNKIAKRSFAPHKWNYILENKDAKELGRLLGI